jgi:hypothetical protein
MMLVMFELAPADEIIALLVSIGIPLVGTSFMFVAMGFIYYRYVVRTKIEAASARVLQAHPELAQSTEDFRVFARKVMCELGWDHVSFTF